jgi:glycosidase
MRLAARYFWVFLIIITLHSCNRSEADCNCSNIQVPQPTGFQIPAIADIQMYEVNMRAFSAEGTFKGVQYRLDSIKNLGTNVIWLMPIYPIGVERRSFGLGSPYSISDFRAINPELGTLADFKELVKEAHNRKMAVIIDWVANHTSFDHKWITEHPDWYTKDATGAITHPPTTNWLDVADLDYSKQPMRQAMISDMRYWLEEIEVDGLRCDAANFVPDDFWKQAIDSIKTNAKRNYILLAEGDRPQQLNAGFQMNYAWTAFTTIKNVMAGSPATQLPSAIMAEDGAIPTTARKLRFTTNHDESAWDKTPIQMFGGQNASIAAFVAVTCMTGNTLVYGSQETGRTPLLPFFTKDQINWSENPATYSAYRNYLRFRDTSKVMKYGAFTSSSTADIICIKKKYQEIEIFALVNVRNREVSFNLPPNLRNKQVTNLLTGAPVALSDTIKLQAYQYLIMQ